jgi:hypothetical protein
MAYKQTTLEILISDIKLTGENPRKDFDKEHLNELAQSIGEKGIWNPVIVRPGKDGKVELMDPYEAIRIIAVPIGCLGGFAFIGALSLIDRIHRALEGAS